MDTEEGYMLPYYFDDGGVLKSHVKVGDYITIESEGKSSQKKVKKLKISKSGTRYLLDAQAFLPVLLYSIITNDNMEYGKIIISEGEYRGTVYEDKVGDLGSGSYEPVHVDFEFKINPRERLLAFTKGLNERLNEDSPLLELPFDLFQKIGDLLPGRGSGRAGRGKKSKRKKSKRKSTKKRRSTKKRKYSKKIKYSKKRKYSKYSKRRKNQRGGGIVEGTYEVAKPAKFEALDEEKRKKTFEIFSPQEYVVKQKNEGEQVRFADETLSPPTVFFTTQEFAEGLISQCLIKIG